jgi:hypothetical protein
MSKRPAERSLTPSSYPLSFYCPLPTLFANPLVTSHPPSLPPIPRHIPSTSPTLHVALRTGPKNLFRFAIRVPSPPPPTQHSTITCLGPAVCCLTYIPFYVCWLCKSGLGPRTVFRFANKSFPPFSHLLHYLFLRPSTSRWLRVSLLHVQVASKWLCVALKIIDTMY